MIVFHAGYHDGALHFWGEEAGRKRPASKRAGRAPNLHPFGAGRRHISSALKVARANPKLSRFCRVGAWLPTCGGAPLPSPDAGEPARPADDVTLQRWTVTAYSLPPHEAVGLLLSLVGRQTLPAGGRIGADLAYWIEALRLAGLLLARRQFLPGLANDSGKYRAVWNLLLVGEDAQRLKDLAGRMPPAARALAGAGAAPPARAAVAVLREAVGMMADSLVRAAASASAGNKYLAKRRFASIHDAWLHALVTAGSIRDQRNRVQQLAPHIREWLHPLDAPAGSPFGLCFRLEEPSEENPDTWYVRYMVQSNEDPSLLVPAWDVWEEDSAFNREGACPKGSLLILLGRASVICPDIISDLEGGSLSGHALDTAGAYDFLSVHAPALRQAGYAVMLPSWWGGRGAKTRLEARASVRAPKMRGGGLSLETIMSFDWETALGDQSVTLEELEELARAKSPLVRVRGRWMAMNASEIKKAVKFLKKMPAKAAFRDLIRMELGAVDVPDMLDFGIDAVGQTAAVLESLGQKAGFESLEQPEGFSGTLRPYQVRGYSWLSFLSRWGLGGCLADDMGLGKTVQILALIQRDWRKSGRPALLVCPTSVMSNWQREAARFTPELPVMMHHGADRLRDGQFGDAARKHAIVVSSYGLMQRDVDFLMDVSWRGVVLDEAQNIKNPQTLQAGAARSLTADYRFALTGTPVENSVGDLWSIMQFLNPGFLGTQAQFKRNFFTPIQAEQDGDAARRLRRATGPFILRRLKTDKSIISDLPEKMEMNVFCSLTREQASLYASVLKDVENPMYEAEGMQRRGIILSTLSKLKQICNHPAQFLKDGSAAPGRSGKLARLTEMLEEVLQVGDRALVFTQFAEMGRILQDHLQKTFGIEALFLHGGVPKRRRDKMVERFEGDGGPRIFVLSLKAGGTGLNLASANHVFHFDRWWNPAVESQATDRAYRIGQSRNVQVHKFVCAGTLEEKIDGMIERKKQMAEMTVGSGEGWLTEMSNDDLRQVLALSREAAGA